MIAILVKFVLWVGSSLISLLPESPLTGFDFGEFSAEHLQWLNWLVPVDTILQIMALWLGAAVAYWVISMVLRFFKVIE